jgi:hypothetical protein
VARVGVGVNAGAVLGAARSRRGRPSWALGAGVPAVNPGAWGRILAAWGWHWQLAGTGIVGMGKAWAWGRMPHAAWGWHGAAWGWHGADVGLAHLSYIIWG